MAERDELDQLIDSALASYAEPRPGLEQRMLARISAEAVRSSRRHWILAAIAAPALAALILASNALLRSPHSQRGQTANTPAIAPVASAVTVPTPHVRPKVVSKHRIEHQASAVDRATNNAMSRPKQDIFPAPQPLSAGEQALIQFAAQASEADRKTLIEAQQRVEEPLKISAIRIPPLQSPEENH